MKKRFIVQIICFFLLLGCSFLWWRTKSRIRTFESFDALPRLQCSQLRKANGRVDSGFLPNPTTPGTSTAQPDAYDDISCLELRSMLQKIFVSSVPRFSVDTQDVLSEKRLRPLLQSHFNRSLPDGDNGDNGHRLRSFFFFLPSMCRVSDNALQVAIYRLERSFASVVLFHFSPQPSNGTKWEVEDVQCVGMLPSQDMFQFPRSFGERSVVNKGTSVNAIDTPIDDSTDAVLPLLRQKLNYHHVLPSDAFSVSFQTIGGKKVDDSSRNNYRCYGGGGSGNGTSQRPPPDRKLSCEHPRYGGTWDAPCVTDNDCPFYRANRNYDNNRGGCLSTGQCEFPLGMVAKSPRKVADPSAGLCHNCSKAHDWSCCVEQKQRRNDFMESPDYAYINDVFDRFRHAPSLELRRLKP